MTTETRTCEINVSAIKAALLFTGKEDIRGYLNGTCVEHGPLGVRLIATDGHRMLVQKIGEPDPDSPEVETVRFIVGNDTLKAAVKLAGKAASMTCVWQQTRRPDETRSDVTVVETAKISIGGIAATDLQDTFGKYPTYERIVPRSISGELAQFNAYYLADCAKAKEILTGSKMGYVTVGHNGNGPALLNISDAAFAVLMPMRGDKIEDIRVPEWFDATAANVTQREAA